MGFKWNPLTGELDLTGGSTSADTLKTLLLNSIVTHTGEAPLETAFIVIDNDGNVVFT